MEESRQYSNHVLWYTQLMYLFVVVIYILLIGYYRVHEVSILGMLILIAPLIIFAVNYNYLHTCTVEVEASHFNGSFLAFAVISAVVIVNWGKDGAFAKHSFFLYLIIAITLVALSSVDFWVPKEWVIFVGHFRSILQTLALTVLAYMLVMYWNTMTQLHPSENGSSVGLAETTVV